MLIVIFFLLTNTFSYNCCSNINHNEVSICFWKFLSIAVTKQSAAFAMSSYSVSFVNWVGSVILILALIASRPQKQYTFEHKIP